MKGRKKKAFEELRGRIERAYPGARVEPGICPPSADMAVIVHFPRKVSGFDALRPLARAALEVGEKYGLDIVFFKRNTG